MDQLDLSTNFKLDEDNRLAGVISLLIRASWGVYLFVVITALYYHDWRGILVTLIGCVLLVGPYILLRKRYLQASSLIIMLIELGTVTFIATVGQGIQDLAVLAFPIIFIFAGLVLDRTYFRICVGLTLIAVFWLVFGEYFGWFITVPFQGNLTNWFYLVGVTIILLVAALAVELLATNLRRNLDYAKREVIQRKQAEEIIRQLNAELEQRVEERTRELKEAQEQLVRKGKLAVLGQMAGSVSHELRNPLGVIKTAVYYLKTIQPDVDVKVKECYAMIEKEVHNSEKIINDLLGFARNHSAQQEKVSLTHLLQTALDRFPVPPGVELSLEVADDLPMVFADPRHVEQVLGNLIINANQAMESRGNLIITACCMNGMVAIAVKDTGVGISEENMSKLFEPLFTTKAKGIGLGLAVSQRLAEANGGKIEVVSGTGKGSTFTLYLPIHP